jgi:hypothetical protein
MPQYPYNTPVGVNYKNITAAGTVAVKTTGGFLNSIVINQPGTVTSTFVLNDGTLLLASYRCWIQRFRLLSITELILPRG